MGIPYENIFHDLYVEKYHDLYSQIDVVLKTEVGLIVFEIKEYSGWIFGNGNHQYWTQILAYGQEKYRFYNPVMQNEVHIEAIRNKLPRNMAHIPIFSMIIFYGNCTLKKISNIPDNTFVGYSNHVAYMVDSILRSNPIFDYGNETEIIDILKVAEENGANQEIVNRHINNIRQFTNSSC